MDENFQILSLDGGGIKGLFSAAVLAAIEEDLRVEVTDHFDLIVGTSTGGIIALGLGLGLKPEKIVDFYFGSAKRIFRNRLCLRSLLRVVRSKFPQSALRKALQADNVFGDRLLLHSTKRLVIPAYNLGEDDVYIFKTPHHERLRRDLKVPAWQVALATCAAPTYFQAARHIDCLRHIDGGVWANNPIMVGVTEAVGILGVSLDQIRVLSLGTTDSVCRRSRSMDRGGLLQWVLPAAGVFLRAQSIAAHNQAVHLLGKARVTRIDPKVPAHLFGLDKESRRDELMAKAAHESRVLMPEIGARFMTHRAESYTPCHSVSDM